MGSRTFRNEDAFLAHEVQDSDASLSTDTVPAIMSQSTRGVLHTKPQFKMIIIRTAMKQ